MLSAQASTMRARSAAACAVLPRQRVQITMLGLCQYQFRFGSSAHSCLVVCHGYTTDSAQSQYFNEFLDQDTSRPLKYRR